MGVGQSCARQRRLGAVAAASMLAASTVLGAVFPPGSVAAPVASAACPAKGGAPDPDHAVLLFNVCGPREVTPNKRYAYTVVLTNGGGMNTGKVKLSVFHRDPITKSSVPYRDSSRRVQYGMYEAVWRLGDLARGRSFRVTITVTLGLHKPNAQFTEIRVKAAGEHGAVTVG